MFLTSSVIFIKIYQKLQLLERKIYFRNTCSTGRNFGLPAQKHTIRRTSLPQTKRKSFTLMQSKL